MALGTQEGTSSGSPPENGAASEPAGMRPRDASERRDDFRAGLRTKGFAGTAVAGMAASISNPYWIIWWATVGAAYVATSAGYGVAGPATFFVGHIAADLAWYSLVSFAIATGTRFFNDRVYRGILYVCGFLFLFGAYFLRLGVSNTEVTHLRQCARKHSRGNSPLSRSLLRLLGRLAVFLTLSNLDLG